MIDLLQDAWDVTEPIVGFLGIGIAIWYWIHLQLVKRKKYLNKGSKRYVVALQVGRPIAEAVKLHFGELDTLIEVNNILGKTTLEVGADYKKLANEVYKALAHNQDSEIHLIVSGPVGLNILIGQLIGMNHFDVTVYQYDPELKKYSALPIPDRTWINH